MYVYIYICRKTQLLHYNHPIRGLGNHGSMSTESTKATLGDALILQYTLKELTGHVLLL